MKLTEQVLHDVARFSESDRTVLSAYLNLSDGWNEAEVFVNRESGRLLPILSPQERDSFEASVSFLFDYLRSKRAQRFSGPGLAFFADLGADATRGIELVMPPEPLLAIDEQAVLQPLALQLGRYEPVGVIMIDAHCTKILVTAGQVLETLSEFCEKVHQLSKPGGWSQMRYQRRHGEQMRHFAKDVVEAAQTVFDAAGVRRVFVAGRDRMITALEAEFPKAWKDRVVGKVRWDLDAPGDELVEKIRPILEEAEREQERNLLERVVAEIRRHGLGTGGVEATLRALNKGQVDTLVLSDTLDPQTSEELISLAESTGAHVEFVPGENEELIALGNAGALLRFRIS
jgi:peptide subunit release factor 1 (eRF1)